MEQKIIYSCKEHVEMAIDDFVNEIEQAPQIIKIENKKCSYCNEKAEYEIKN